MNCAICQAPCRGKCAKCGAPLCAAHKPPRGARSTCPLCPRRTAKAPRQTRTPTRQPTTRASLLAPSQPVALATLTLPEQLAWIAERRTRLQQKQARERAYLDRRAARGTHTPTDDAYEADQELENDLFAALNLLEALLQSGTASGSNPTSSTYAGNTSFLFPDPSSYDKLQP